MMGCGGAISVSLLLLLLSCFTEIALAGCDKAPVLFVFGDSNSDTGGLASGLGFPINPPNGRNFFHRSTGRLSDGRLLIDLLSTGHGDRGPNAAPLASDDVRLRGLSLNASLLVPYLDALSGTSFTNGANFAVVGSSTLPKYVPFSLNIQVMQFRRFKARSLELVTAGARNLINDEGFRDALYLIDIGQNDLADSFAKNLSYAQVIKKIPAVITEIENAVKNLYNDGARKFWVHNTGPLGCLPKILALAQKKDLDSLGCLSSYNSAARLFNEELLHSTQKLRSELKDATLVYVDIYTIKYDLITNAAKYGFSNPLMVCCGYGGPPYNFDVRVTCGQPGYQVCDEGARYVSWDGIHQTEAANTLIASKILSMAYSTPRTPFDFFCHQ
ncbi:GDSL esterase/lipase At1g09390 isoform X1 [Glycine max]|uniref:GDSL esterase/lipase At1g09390 isoform X1 n=1 Tax=Glycine max TaxID=3847 RepID=UPI0007191496|nr:GDSL esterase/lipase At1g09390 isoform X1 [Glycine max]|eukprot:XP_014629468.1 GDSL esterase/lipase At1g09390 isoform X1 [Glycine max]